MEMIMKLKAKAARALRRCLEGAGNVEREARETSAPAPHEAVDEAYGMRQAHREVAFEILGRKEAILEAKFNGKKQSMESLLAEMRADSDFSDVPEIFDWKWDDKTQSLVPDTPRKVEFK